jgi:hypothetical protein
MMIKKLVELLAGETEVLGKNLPQFRFVHHESHMPGLKDPSLVHILSQTNALHRTLSYF